MFKTFFKSNIDDSSLRNDNFEALRNHKDLDPDDMVFKKKLTQHDNAKNSVKKYFVLIHESRNVRVFIKF